MNAKPSSDVLVASHSVEALNGRALIVDREASSNAIADALKSKGCAVEIATDAFDAAARMHSFRPDILIAETAIPGTDGGSLLEQARRYDPLLSVVLLTNVADVSEAVRAIKDGAEHYMARPVAEPELFAVVKRVLDRQRSRQRLGIHRTGSRVATPQGFIAESEPMRALMERIALVAPQKTTVLLLGETGTGKERVAEAVHAGSTRADQPFVRVHCSALTETLLESELFGHERGAFTGAVARREGRFKLADRGTLFLDEIGDITPATQVKLLRVLQERQFERVGGNEIVAVDVRIIAATNRDLPAMVAAGTFRADLYYRLNVLALEIPPLRARRSDIPLLVEYTLARLAAQLMSRPPAVTPDAMRLLMRCEWPGNVRELENVLERALVLSRGAEITVSGLAPSLRTRDTAARSDLKIPGATFADIERHAILTTYDSCGRNVLRTAEILGISPRTVHYRLREYRGQPGRRRGRIALAAPATVSPGAETVRRTG